MKRILTFIFPAILLITTELSFSCANQPETPPAKETAQAPPAQETAQPTGAIVPPSPTPFIVVNYKDYTVDWTYESGILTILTPTGLDNWSMCMTKNYLVSESIIKETSAIVETMEELVFMPGITEIARIEFCNFHYNENDYSKLRKITLPDGLIKIGDSAFAGLRALQEINLPDTIEEIGGGAFGGCLSLESFSIPPKVSVLKDSLLASTYSLTELYIPESVKELWIACLDGSGVHRIIFEGTIEFIENMRTLFMPNLSQLVFLDKPPIDYLGNPPVFGDTIPTDVIGLEIYDKDAITIYYLTKNAEYWAPNGETEWLGCKLVAIELLDDLPEI